MINWLKTTQFGKFIHRAKKRGGSNVLQLPISFGVDAVQMAHARFSLSNQKNNSRLKRELADFEKETAKNR